MPRTALTSLDVTLYSIVVFAWGFSWIALHYQVGVVAPEISVAWRFALAVPLMFAIAIWRGESLRFAARDHLLLAGMGVTLFSTNFTLFYYGGQYLPSGLLAVVFSLASVINVWLGFFVLKNPIDPRVVAGGLLGFCGIAAMFYPQLAGTTFNHTALLGLGLCVSGTFLFCLGNMISAAMQRRGIGVFSASSWGMVYGVAASCLLAALHDAPFTIDTAPSYIAGLIFLAVISSVFAFGAYLTLLGRIGADRAGYSTVLFPVVALVVSTFFENYRWTTPAILGLAAVLAGNLLVLRAPRAK